MTDVAKSQFIKLYEPGLAEKVTATAQAVMDLNDEALEAALNHAKTVPVRPTLIDLLTEEEWLDEGAHDWDITVGKLKPR